MCQNLVEEGWDLAGVRGVPQKCHRNTQAGSWDPQPPAVGRQGHLSNMTSYLCQEEIFNSLWVKFLVSGPTIFTKQSSIRPPRREAAPSLSPHICELLRRKEKQFRKVSSLSPSHTWYQHKTPPKQSLILTHSLYHNPSLVETKPWE